MKETDNSFEKKIWNCCKKYGIRFEGHLIVAVRTIYQTEKKRWSKDVRIWEAAE